jgi:hypothetical protein
MGAGGDLLSPSQNNPYVGCEAVNMGALPYTYTTGVKRGVIVTASGNVVLTMLNGSTVIIPVVVETGGFVDVRGFAHTAVTAANTATVTYGME